MAWSDFIRKFQVPNITIVEGNSNDYDTEKVGTVQIPDTLKDNNAFNLANTVAEIFNPIDFYADRASKIRYYIADKNGVELTAQEYKRYIDEINPLYTFSDLIYQAVFSYLSDGNLYLYQNVPSMYERANSRTISRIDVLNPNYLSIDEYTNISKLDVIRINDFIKRAYYNDGKKREIDKEKMLIFMYDWQKRDYSNFICRSPLFKSYRNINNLLATYSARYNIYVNNGAAGYLAKKANSKDELEETLNPTDREAILKDINNRNGITGSRNLWGISSVPIEFVNTLSDIQKLMPFEETLEDAIKIAATYQLPSVLVARKDQSTFNNQKEAERSVWENGLMSIIDTIASYFTKAWMFENGVHIQADYSTVSALNENESEKQDMLSKKVLNYSKLYESGLMKYNDYLTKLGLEPITDGDRYIYEMTKQPYAVKLGVGGTQAMQMILSDVNIPLKMKENILTVIFGLSEEEAKRITEVN